MIDGTTGQISVESDLSRDLSLVSNYVVSFVVLVCSFA